MVFSCLMGRIVGIGQYLYGRLTINGKEDLKKESCFLRV